MQTTAAFEPFNANTVYVRGRDIVSGCTSAAASFTPAGVNNRNLIITNLANKPGLKSGAELQSQTIGDKSQSIAYFDGLGDPDETVLTGATPYQKDLVTFQTYDALRRPYIHYLPVPCSSATAGSYIGKTSFESQSSAYYNGFFPSDGGTRAETIAYSATLYEDSPLNRVKETIGPGAEWRSQVMGQDKSVRTAYSLLDAAQETVPYYTYDYATGTATRTSNAAYATGALSIVETSDEDGLMTRTYTDALGKTILTRRDGNTSGLYTLSVYDSKGQLRFIVSPEGYAQLASETLAYGSTFQEKYCQAFNYDARGRLTEKHIPGAGPTYYVYDGGDRVILEQTALQRADHIWQFYRYDLYGRSIYEGFITSNAAITRQAWQSGLDAFTGPYYETRTASSPWYTLSGAYPDLAGLPSGSSYQVNVWNFYDENAITGPGYSFLTSAAGNDYSAIPLAESTLGMLMQKRVRVIDPTSTTPVYLLTTFFYDPKGRIVQQRAENILGGEDVTTSFLHFNGKPEHVSNYHTSSKLASWAWNEHYTYDHAWRLTTVSHGAQQLALYAYSELGQVKRKTVAGQHIDYRHNIRGWLTHINDPASLANDYFAQRINYTPLDNDAIAVAPLSTPFTTAAPSPASGPTARTERSTCINMCTTMPAAWPMPTTAPATWAAPPPSSPETPATTSFSTTTATATSPTWAATA